MSNEFIKAADEARRLIRGFQALDSVAAALDKAGAAIQAKTEAEAALSGLHKEIADAHAQLDAAKADAKAEIDNAKAKAKKIVDDAAAKADELILGAQAKLDAERAKYEADVQKAAHDLAAALAAADEAEARRDTALRELADIEAKIEKARAYLAKLAG